jgi:hypothetical protein
MPESSVLVDRAQLLGLVRRAEEHLGQLDLVGSSAAQLADRVLRELTPKLKALLAEGATVLEPMIRTSLKEEIAPKLALAAGTALFFAGVISGLVGAGFASRRCS